MTWRFALTVAHLQMAQSLATVHRQARDSWDARTTENGGQMSSSGILVRLTVYLTLAKFISVPDTASIWEKTTLGSMFGGHWKCIAGFIHASVHMFCVLASIITLYIAISSVCGTCTVDWRCILG